MYFLPQMKNNGTYTKWFNMPGLTDILVFLFPPIGIYILYKQKKKVLKPTEQEVK